MTFPSPPWRLQGQMWLSVFLVRPGGLYGAAFVDYEDAGTLSYRELLVARLVRGATVPRVRVTDMWVNSRTSREGGRALWAMPKELADLHVRERRLGPGSGTAWDASRAAAPLAAARFTHVQAPAPRAPFAFHVSQPRHEAPPVVSRVSGTARLLPCHGRWEFSADGPLSWLAGHRPVASVRVADFRITFGG